MRAIREIIDLSNGHCFFPVPPKATQVSVLINGYPAIRSGDSYGAIVTLHSCGPAVHPPGIVTGVSTVLVEGLPIAKEFDFISCGDTAGNGSNDVLIGG